MGIWSSRVIWTFEVVSPEGGSRKINKIRIISKLVVLIVIAELDQATDAEVERQTAPED